VKAKLKQVFKKTKFQILVIGTILCFAGYVISSLIFFRDGKVAQSNFIQLLDYVGIVLGYLIGCFSLSAGLIAYLKRHDIRRWLYRSRFESTGEPFEIDEEKVEAMVIPVSRREQPEWLLRWLNPKKVALICTERTKDTSREIEEKFGNEVVFYPAKVIKDPDDPDETRQEIKHCLSRFKAEGIHPTHIFVDTTGGKVPMSIGAFLAAEEEGVSSIYLVGKVERNGVMIVDDPENREHGRPIFISNHTQE